MQFHSRHPGGEIGVWLEKLWLLEVSSDELAGIERCAPDGAVEIMVHLGTPLVEVRGDKRRLEHPRSAVVGHLVGPVLLEPRGPVRVAAARLRPSAVGPIFRLPAHELVDETLAAEELLGRPGRLLVERVASADDPLLELAEAIHELVRDARRSELACRAERKISEARGQLKLVRLAQALGTSPRSLQRHFRDQLGISPKRFATLRRFEETCRRLRRSPPASLVDIALSSGYADQAHFTREFRSLIGVPPRRWLAKRRRLHGLLNQGCS